MVNVTRSNYVLTGGVKGIWLDQARAQKQQKNVKKKQKLLVAWTQKVNSSKGFKSQCSNKTNGDDWKKGGKNWDQLCLKCSEAYIF